MFRQQETIRRSASVRWNSAKTRIRREHLCEGRRPTNNDCCVPCLGLRVLVELSTSQCTLASLLSHSVYVLNVRPIGNVLCVNVRRSRSASGVCRRLAAGKLAVIQCSRARGQWARTGVADEVAIFPQVLSMPMGSEGDLRGR